MSLYCKQYSTHFQLINKPLNNRGSLVEFLTLFRVNPNLKLHPAANPIINIRLHWKAIYNFNVPLKFSPPVKVGSFPHSRFNQQPISSHKKAPRHYLCVRANLTDWHSQFHLEFLLFVPLVEPLRSSLFVSSLF